MANKNPDNEKRENVVSESTMTAEQMEQFITENIGLVPRNQKKKFETLTMEQKVEKLRFYIERGKMWAEAAEKNKLENKVKVLFVRHKATTEDVLNVIEFCKKYIESTKQEELNKLQMEIDRLTHLKQSLESN